MPQTQPDVETPQKPKKIDTAVSPAKTEPLSPMGHSTISVEQRSQPRGLWGIGRPKTFMMGGLCLILIGGVVYFLLEWLEIPGLNEQLDRLEGEVDRLEEQNNVYKDLNKQLETTSKALNSSVVELTVQVDELEMVNKDLQSVSDFLNETAGQLGQTVDEISDFLGKQIEANKALVLGNLENTMKQRIMGWDCSYGNLFASRDWGSNFDIAISAQDWDEVLGYVNENVLEETCLSLSDFEDYFTANSVQWPKWNSKNLISAVSAYSTAALDWYFPEEGETGLTHTDWAAASYDCQQLTTKFTYSLVSS